MAARDSMHIRPGALTPALTERAEHKKACAAAWNDATMASFEAVRNRKTDEDKTLRETLDRPRTLREQIDYWGGADEWGVEHIYCSTLFDILEANGIDVDGGDDHGAAPSRAIIALHLRAPNDVNGNPRRLYLFLGDAGQVAGVKDEGYLGVSAARQWMDEHFPGVALLYGPHVDISASEYRNWKKWTP